MTTNEDTSPRAGLDLDAITKRARRVYPKRGWDGGEAERALPVVTEDAPALVARVRDLTAKFDAAAQAYDDILAQVWRATGETHEPPADVAALTDRVDALRCEAESLTRRLAAAGIIPRSLHAALCEHPERWSDVRAVLARGTK